MPNNRVARVPRSIEAEWSSNSRLESAELKSPATTGGGARSGSGLCRGYLHSVMVCMAVSASPWVGYLPSILYFFMSLGSAFIVVHFFADIYSIT